MPLIAAAAGHGIDQLLRGEAILTAPFKDGRYVAYSCTGCDFATGWMSNEDLAKGCALRHFAEDLAGRIDVIEAGGGNVSLEVFG